MLFSSQDQFDTIDLSDNEIVKLENFPHLNRLGTLLINNNRITRINPNLGGNVLFVCVVIKCKLEALFALLLNCVVFCCMVVLLQNSYRSFTLWFLQITGL